ncbi:MAG: ABC transporter ATP-binding protein [Candidatus Vogelbacteria bacterium CG10_big_fil_rev_8_21_14_0_10_49_38]|uniref:ABC transporter ATP-binding protein n=1 Tax=Candidatus Vogelbacteria bacterium CG10_big_fil_rev_8_21_14_0_10_49_38 TaxID=1975043 RepID=A0A2H0RHI9_9BACT|nr:MAG: ABC transporter ATP-binding protein [bacterium CG10_49_38]PIR45999.1 MAG: ABC transporter ATP-binding protein [Candidatus Vogelbacteria bacterium CG10_big_fil_rev_8_21_14_0_10_49_38]
MTRVWNYVKNYKQFLFLSLLLATINQVFSLLDPQLARLIVDRYATRASDYTRSEFVSGILILLLLSVLVALISRIAKNFQDYYVNMITQRVSAKLYADSVEHSFSLPYHMFEDQRSGELLQKLQKARQDIQVLIISLINTVFLSLVGILFVVAYALSVHWLIGLVYFALIPILGGFNFYITRRIKTIQKNIVAQTAGLAGSTTETLRNIELVKSLGLEDQEVSRLNNTNDQILKLELQKIQLVRILSFFQGTFINSMRVVLLALMLILIFEGQVSVGEYFTLLIYSFFIFGPLSDFGTVSAQYQEAKASMEQLESVLSLTPEVKPTEPVFPGPLNKLEFKQVTFKHQTASQASLININLKIERGETVAFVGPSGAGKSTLVKMLVGLYDPTEGVLLVNGLEMNRLDRAKYRKRIGLVAQETQLFAGTIRENLLFVNPQATDEECLSALGQASALSIVERGNKGLDSKIGEGGLKISGGERQRLAIARALLRRPDLIIFDEATSSLDSITEREISRTIGQVVKNNPEIISVLVAHRLSTIAHAKRIYVLEKGVMVEQGTHQELLELKGLYAALWREQSSMV